MRKILIILTFFSASSYSQEDSLIKLNTGILFSDYSFKSNKYYFHKNKISFSPSKEDTLFIKDHYNLLFEKPTELNYKEYYKLACSYFELKEVIKAEKMFNSIIHCNGRFYNNDYHNSSDIISDNSTNSYGYGSFSSNYKNLSSRYLSEIYIYTKEYSKALNFVTLADKKYHIYYTCGTGAMSYEREILGLYNMCYDGLKLFSKIIELNIDNYYENNPILIKAILKQYSKEEIINELIKSLKSQQFTLDKHKSMMSTIHNFGKENEFETTIKYTLGVSKINLFGKLIEMEHPNLKNNEASTKQMYIEKFKRSEFYIELIK